MINFEALLVCNLLVSVYLAYKVYELSQENHILFQGLATVMMKLGMSSVEDDDD